MTALPRSDAVTSGRSEGESEAFSVLVSNGAELVHVAVEFDRSVPMNKDAAADVRGLDGDIGLLSAELSSDNGHPAAWRALQEQTGTTCTEIQSVASCGNVVAAVDDWGRCGLLGSDDPTAGRSQFLPASGRNAENSWCGLCVNARDVATCNMFERSVAVFDIETATRRVDFVAKQCPTVIAFAPPGMISGSESVLLVGEYSSICAYDVRTSPQRSVLRWSSGSQPLYAIDSRASHGQVAVGGANRAVHVLECRKWNSVGAWNGALKYEVTSAFFAEEETIYVAGMDGTVAKGNWKRGQTSEAAQGDGRYLGVCRPDVSGAAHEEVLLGFTESGALYLTQFLPHASA
jgi:hypothetical protein